MALFFYMHFRLPLGTRFRTYHLEMALSIHALQLFIFATV